MTINSTIRKAGPYSGTGSQTAFPFAFKVFLASEVVVVQTNSSGVETTKVLNTDYTVALSLDQNANPGGTVNMIAAPPSGSLLTLISGVTSTQGQSIPNNGGFYPKVVEDGLDRLTILVQQLFEQVGRAVKYAVSDTVSVNSFPTQTARANNLLGFDASGNIVAVTPVAGSATQVQMALAAGNGASLIGGGDQIVSSIAGLRALLKTSPSNNALVTGYYAAGDGGGGLYYYDPTDITSTDNGGTIIVASDGGRWKLVLNDNAINVKQFGARGDGATNDTGAIAAAIAALPATGGKLNFLAGTYITDTIIFPNYPKTLNLIGIGRASTFLQALNQNAPILQGAATIIPSNATACNLVSGMSFKAHALGSTGPALNLIRFSFSRIEKISFEANSTGQWAYGILLDASDHCYSNYIHDVEIKVKNPITQAVIHIQNHANLHYISRLVCTVNNVLCAIKIENQIAPGTSQAIFVEDCHFEGLTSVVNGAIDPGNAMLVVVQNSYFENVVNAIAQTGNVLAINNFFAASPGVSINNPWPLGWTSIGNNYSGGMNAHNTLGGRLSISGANGTSGELEIRGDGTSIPGTLRMYNPTSASFVTGQFDGTYLNINTPFKTANTELAFSTGTLAAFSGANTATLTNCPVVGNPRKWVRFQDAGGYYYMPAW